MFAVTEAMKFNLIFFFPFYVHLKEAFSVRVGLVCVFVCEWPFQMQSERARARAHTYTHTSYVHSMGNKRDE